MSAVSEPKLYGLLAEYDRADPLIEAIKKVRAEGYTKIDGYSPYAVAGIADALGFVKTEMATIMLTGGIVGATSAFLMQWWANAIEYPLNIGGRASPDMWEWLKSWPSFIPITFEGGILTCALSGVFGLVAICGLPRPHHPLFNADIFSRCSRDRFFLAVEAADPKFDLEATKALLATLSPLSVTEVPA